MSTTPPEKQLELINTSLDPLRPNRLCVSLSDIHLTDGSVGFQNLGKHTWDAFYDGIAARCRSYEIKEMRFVLDGDVVDMIRSAKWAEKGVYPWQRESDEFPVIVNDIIKEIVDVQHKEFFTWLKELPEKLKADAGVEDVDVIVLLGNHDKELLSDQKALGYFYQQGLGKPLHNITETYRRAIGRMYGDEEMFVDPTTAPYLPFYYGDSGFRFFTTHGQWRDKENSRKVKAEKDLPAWSSADGWQNERWQKLGFSPFLLPCFGDTVAAGILSTFIYKTRLQLQEAGYHDDRLTSILNEMDLYRPTYKAISRILEETRAMRAANRAQSAVKIIEETLYACVMQWLSWDFTYHSSPPVRRIVFRLLKFVLRLMKVLGFGLEIKSIATLMKALSRFSNQNDGLSLQELAGLPAFMPAYRHYGFQIHGEGHTHVPWEEEPNLKTDKPSSYINFGTWRDQIVSRKKSGYRRRSVLRALFILDLRDETPGAHPGDRSFNYYTDDIIHWSDKSDMFSQKGKHQPHI